MKSKRYRYRNRFIVVTFLTVQNMYSAVVETANYVVLHREYSAFSETALNAAKLWVDTQEGV